MPKGIVGGAGSYSFEVNKFHDFFHDLFKFSMSFGLAVTFENFQNVLVLAYSLATRAIDSEPIRAREIIVNY